MKNNAKYFIISIIFIIVVFIFYYCYPRKVPFELVKEINKPNKDFERIDYIGFDYVENEERFKYYMTDYYSKESCSKDDLKGYSSCFVETIAEELDFLRYDYIITYQKKLISLRHSPKLTKTEDNICFDSRTPLIPIWDSEKTDKIFIYRITNNNRFRAPGP